ncbi:MAG: hypothetical protein D6710_08845 [Nitrospirae bacterium]|nr:MAG: hypothetical protein D6710_08845 [Nitrospirota bacterium]
MKKKTSLFIIIFLLLSLSVKAEVLKETTVHAKQITLYLRGNIRLPLVVDNKLVFSEFGGKLIKNIDRLDVVVDREGRLQGIRLIYDDRVSGKKSIFFPKIKSIVFERPGKETPQNALRLRVVTIDEIIDIW